MNAWIFPLLFLFLSGCGRDFSAPKKGKPLALVSIAPYQFLVAKIAGDALDVQTIIPSRANPHAFEPTSRQVEEIARGELWFRIGEPFEKKILPLLLENSPNLVVSDLLDGIDLQPADPGSHPCCHSADHLDRHVWLSPKLARLQALHIEEVLSQRFPEKREEFQKNLQNCLAQLDALDQEIQAILAPLEERALIVSHSAFGYFCREYGLQQLSLEQEGKDPRPRHLQEILAKARKTHAALALALPQHNNKGAQIIADEMKVPIRMIDPYSADYFGTLRHLAHLIADPHQETPSP